MTYVAGIDDLTEGQFEMIVDGEPTRLHFTEGQLKQEPGAVAEAELTVRTTSTFSGRMGGRGRRLGQGCTPPARLLSTDHPIAGSDGLRRRVYLLSYERGAAAAA